MPRGRPPGIPKTGGRKAGVPNKRTVQAEEAARAIVDNPEVQARWLREAKAGKLSPVMLQTLCYYAWGKPVERVEHSGNADKPLLLAIRRDLADAIDVTPPRILEALPRLKTGEDAS